MYYFRLQLCSPMWDLLLYCLALYKDVRNWWSVQMLTLIRFSNAVRKKFHPWHSTVLESWLSWPLFCFKSLQLYPTLCDPVDCSLPSSSVHGLFQAKNTGVDCHFLLQGIVPTQGSNLFMSFALAGGFFTISAAWEAPDESFIFCLSKVTPDMLWLKQSP